MYSWCFTHVITITELLQNTKENVEKANVFLYQIDIYIYLMETDECKFLAWMPRVDKFNENEIVCT